MKPFHVADEFSRFDGENGDANVVFYGQERFSRGESSTETYGTGSDLRERAAQRFTCARIPDFKNRVMLRQFYPLADLAMRLQRVQGISAPVGFSFPSKDKAATLRIRKGNRDRGAKCVLPKLLTCLRIKAAKIIGNIERVKTYPDAIIRQGKESIR